MPQIASISRRCGKGSTTEIKRGILARILVQVEDTKGWTNFAYLGARWFGVAVTNGRAWDGGVSWWDSGQIFVSCDFQNFVGACTDVAR